MKRLKIKTKITLWYASLLLVLLVIFSFINYNLISDFLHLEETNLIKTHSDLAYSMVDFENENIILEDLPDLEIPGTGISIYDTESNLVFSNTTGTGNDFFGLILDKPRVFNIDEKWFMVYEEPIYSEKKIVGYIRSSRNLSPIHNTLSRLRIIMVIAIPIYIFLSGLGGWVIANRALTPVSLITRTAKEIGRGDLSKRLDFPDTGDEVGDLASTFDEMISKIESGINREKQFISDASHELRTPVAVISSISEIAALGSKKNKELIDSLKNIYDESKKMNYLISQLLFLSRGDSSTYIKDSEILDLRVILEEVSDEMKVIANKNNIKIKLIAPEKLKIKADQTLVAKLLINLIDNAIKFNRKNGWVSLSLEKSGVFARVTVTDSGIGINPEKIPLIFNRFYQVDKTSKFSGTGLGLSIVKWIVDIHQGQIEVKSKKEIGTRFEVYLPLSF